MTIRATVGRRVLPIGLPTLEQAQAAVQAAEAAASTAAADAVAAAQPGIAQAAQAAADTAAAQVAPAAADAIRAEVAADASTAQTAAVAAIASAADARTGKSPAISGGAGAYLDTSEGPRVEQVARSRHAVETWAGGERVMALDTTDMRYDMAGLDLSMRGAEINVLGDLVVDASEQTRVEVLPAGRRAAKVVGSGAVPLLEYDTLNNALRPAVPAASGSLPTGLMVMRADGSLGLNGVEGATPPLSSTFKTGAWFPELIDSFFLTTDPVYATRPVQMAAAGAITMRPVPASGGGITRVPRLWATFYARNRYDVASFNAEGPGNYVVLAYSDDPVGATGTWHECLYAVPTDTTVSRLYDSFVQNLPNGQIMLTFSAKGGGTTYTDGRTGAYGVIIQNPDDPAGAFVWSDPVDLGVGIMSQMRLAADGRIYGSLDVWAGWDANAAVPWRGKWLSRLNFGRLYDQQPELELVSRLPDIATGTTFDETMIVQTLDGGWLAHFRSSDLGTYETRFNPATQEWSAPVPWSAHPNPLSGTRNSLARSPSGRLVTAFNRHGGQRYNLTVALSDDDGVTWPHYYVFYNPGTSVTYPILSFDNAGLIHVAFDHGRGQNAEGIKNIVWATIPEQSIIDGTPSRTINYVSQ